MDQLDWLKPVLTDFIRLGTVGLISAVLTSSLAYRNFRQQRWWERQADAYTRLIDALIDLSNYFKTVLKIEGLHGREIPDDLAQKLEREREEAERHLLRAESSGAFLFSSEVTESLQNLRKARDRKQEDYWTHLTENEDSVVRCLDQIISASRRDLRLPSGSFLGQCRRR